MSDIFLSYSKKDKARAQIIAEALEAQECSVWWDPKIPPGKTWDEVIKEALNSAKCVIVLWSHKSVLSDWVKEEAEYGKNRRILIPVLIDDVEIPFGFGRIQAAQLIDWDGTLPNPEFDLLLESVSRILGRPPEGEKEKRPLREVKEHRKTEEIPNTHTNSIDMKFVLIPAGEFMMGSEEYNDEKPVHRVKISKPFYLGIYPVTQREWKEVMEKNPSDFKGDYLPVERVSWDDVQKFIKKLNEKEKTNKYRLPSEAEWEYAARAGTKTRYSFGDDESELGDYAWYNDNSGDKTHPVGRKKSNRWELYDMHGNVWEWVKDSWHDNYNGAPADGSAWEGGSYYRVTRGGSWYNSARWIHDGKMLATEEGYSGR